MKFTTDWVSGREQNFIDCMNAIETNNFYDGGRRFFLEVGSFEGRSACWLLQNGLPDDGYLVCIDPFYGVKGFDEANNNLRETFDSNIAEVKKPTQTVEVIEDLSYFGVAKVIEDSPLVPFKFIYVDGAHNARDTLTDLCMTWGLLAKGGTMLIDDYEWHHAEPEQERPKLAVDCFLEVFKGKYEILFKNYQVGLKKL